MAARTHDLAHRVSSWQRSTSVAFGAKRTLTEPRGQLGAGQTSGGISGRGSGMSLISMRLNVFRADLPDNAPLPFSEPG
jgi:hypothetical protein